MMFLLRHPILFFFGSFLLWGISVILFDLAILVQLGMKETISYRLYLLGMDDRLFVFFLGLFSGLLIGGLAVHFWEWAVKP